ncbi:MAG: ferrous iron transport protein B [Lachnospiraceae bacterium]|nr:ferrous iron transport protein B [Lachnospiraceae bacterium]
MDTLRDLKIGQSAIITAVNGEGALRQHLLDMGVIPGTEVTLVKYAPMGDPMEITIHGYKLTLRLVEADKIEVRELTEEDRKEETVKAESDDINELDGRIEADEKKKKDDKKETRIIIHPGLGEEKYHKYHYPSLINPMPEGQILKFALVGNQNSGKTTLFNQLTGSNQHVGNFPGVTVDRKDGAIRGYPETIVTDLPGIYSMSPYSNEELVSRDFVLQEKPDCIINIVDVTNIERNLYLTMQLLEMDVPVVVALNMMDELTENGGTIFINRMEKMLGVPVIPISAAHNQGIEELIKHAIHIARYQEKPLKQDFCDEKDHGGAVHRGIHAIAHFIKDHAVKEGLPVRFTTTKVIEGDKRIIKQLSLEENELETIEHIVIQMEKERNLDRTAAIADMRFTYIKKVCDLTVKKPKESKGRLRSEKIDRILTGKYTAIPTFIIIMALMFFLTFNVIGGGLQALLEAGIDKLTVLTDDLLTAANVNDTLHSLIIDGIFAGLGSVLSFVPIIVTLFFFLSLMEDSGYIARVAFVMDKLLRKIGLSGRSIVPLLIGFGCTVPAVMSTRTLPSERDRRMTILLTPFMSCTAKLPIYAFFVNAFFPRYKALIMTGLYLMGIIVGILVAILYRRTLFKGEAVPFVMELPDYRVPGAKNVFMLLWEKAKDFISRAFSIILIATIIIWLLQSFDFSFNLVSDSKDSILAFVASIFVPLLKPIGLGDWRICTALISGFMAKESVVSTLEVLFGGGITTTISAASAASLLVFSLLYSPCVAAIASIRREMGRKWALVVVIWQCVVAWIASLLVYLIVS